MDHAGESSAVAQAHAEEKSSWINAIKLGCGITTGTFFGLGVRAAWKQAKPLDPSDLTRAKMYSGVAFAARTLGIATLITVSGFGLFVVGISAAMDVHTPSQFGAKVRESFGDRFRIQRGESESYESLSELFEAVSKKEQPKEESVSV
uniref:Transmembrane protein 242 n=1 Tax=Panagrellus redivivus TaxID=6233 RepID=A0A7E4ZSU3_PANRE